MSKRNTDSLLSFYRNAPQTLKRVAPADIGSLRIGHFGFFRAAFAETLWRKYLLPELTMT
jgi:predicted alpha/beta hydrolase